MKISRIRIDDAFWNSTREVIRKEAIPYQWRALNDQVENAEPSYCMRNFRIAAGKETGAHGGRVFQDSDVAKWLEGVAYSLMWHPDPALEKIADGAIDDIVAAQQADGYLDTYYILNPQEEKFSNLMDNHELYCAGHMMEAAVAYFKATGKRKLMDAMLRYAQCIDSHLGAEEGKKKGYPGHPEIELALMKVYDITGDDHYLRMASYFIEQRGQSPNYFEQERLRNDNPFYWRRGVLQYAYYQAHKPLREQRDAVGHAVRALYLYSGLADVARATGDAQLLETCRALWESVTRRQMYITGAVGSSSYGEAFTFDYDLPNDTVYGETCASIALMFFAQRMLKIKCRGEYADVLERALYNTVLAGMQLDGKRFFYVNPLEVVPEACERDQNKTHVKPVRQSWFSCACCPPNVVRLIASLEDYLATVQDDTLYLHTYAGGRIEMALAGETRRLSVETNYPWEGDVVIRAEDDGETPFTLALHIPAWCHAYTVTRSGQPISPIFEDGYLRIAGAWHKGDEIRLQLQMPAVFVAANPKIREDAGKVALMRGPLVYCLEEMDNGPDLHLVRADIGTGQPITTHFEKDLLGGVVTITTEGWREPSWEENCLYREEAPAPLKKTTLRWIPYYAWANREKGEMRVWIRK